MEERLPRKLAAILYADVAEYSRLTGEDEEGTHRLLSGHLDFISDSIRRHQGRVVHYAGDAVLADFRAATDAVVCAAAIQRELLERNAELPPQRRLQFRIGVNLGEVIVDRGDIYGDGVNVAARLEGLASPGGICVSESVFSALGNKLPLDYEFLGEKEVKNIAKPVKAYHARLKPGAELPGPVPARRRHTRIRQPVAMVSIAVLILGAGVLAWLQPWEPRGEADSVAGKSLPLPDKPSIAILPFTNLSGEKEQEYFADGMTDDLITDLSKISGLFVIARNSVFVYKGKAVTVADVGRALGVRYVLEGSVRKANGRVRITAQLVDTVTQGHLWAERYDRHLEDIFALQDEVAQKIVSALSVKLTEQEQKRLVRRHTDNMVAYDYYLRGAEYFSSPTKEANLLARQMHQRAIELDPEFAAAYALLGFSHSQEWTMGWSQAPRSLEIAFELAQKALALDDSLPLGHAVLAEVYLWRGQHDKAIATQQEAMALSPNDAEQIAGLSGILTWAGRPLEALELVKKAMRLNPMYPIEYLWNLGHAYYLMGRHEEAIATLERIRDRVPDYLPPHAYLTASYSELGREEEARAEAAELVRLSPRMSIEGWRSRLPYKDQAVTERLYASLRKAGLR
jgi:adenylate cyclase